MKTVCIYHSIDLDGWMSAAIVKYWWLTNVNPNDKAIGELILDTITKDYVSKYPIFKDLNNLWFIGWNYGQSIPDLSEYDRVIMVDISFPKDEMEKLYKQFATNFIWIDHHISAINDNIHNNHIKDGKDENRFMYAGLRDTKFAACELTWQYFFPNETIPELVRLLGRYDCFGHKGTDEETKVLEFQYGARNWIIDYDSAYTRLQTYLLNDFSANRLVKEIHLDGKAIYSYLCTEAKSIYKRAFPITFIETYTVPKIGLQTSVTNSVIRKFLCVNQERFNPINFGIDYHKDGYDGFACFHMRSDGKWAFSLYNGNDEVDCSTIAKTFGGGGHKGAAGFIVDTPTLMKIFNLS